MSLRLVIPLISLIAPALLFAADPSTSTSPSAQETHQNPISRPHLMDIPTQPSAPPSLSHPVPKDIRICSRPALYRGKLLECDSNQGRDGEHLRPIMHDVPDAIRELNTYQSNRKRVQNLAYVGSVGLLAITLDILVFRNIKSTDTVAVRNLTVVGGFGIMIGTALYGLAILNSNENHLNQAVDNYNKAKPNDPIEIRFTKEF